MSMNKFMHPRNLYRNPPDFKKLALDYPDFRKHANQDLSGKVKLNFKDEGAVWCLTKSLLHKDFNLDVEIVKGRLVPTLPLRMNYLLWIEDLLNLYRSDNTVKGIDIGTGACCIYPLLASRHFSWNLLATEIDTENYQCALDNVIKNKLESQIEVKKVKEGTYLMGVLNGNTNYDFCMCNPPFFGDDKVAKRRNDDCPEPRNAPSGSNIELTTDGGEISFIKAIIDDSTKLGSTIRIYTVMIGCKSSLGILKEYLKLKNVANFNTTMFCQGRTTRWGLAWTYDTSIDLAPSKVLNKKQPVSYNHIIPLNAALTFSAAKQKVEDFLKKFEVVIENELQEEEIVLLNIKARSNTWINSRRKRREERRKNLLPNQMSKDCSANCSNEKKDISTANELARSSDSCKRSPDDNNGTVSKKLKTDQIKSEECALNATLTLRDLDNELDLEIMFLEGSGGKDCAHQLLQCLKNELK